MNILIITPDYPDRYKVHYPFVKQLVDEFARQGHRCYVIAPYSITKNKRFYPLKENDGEVIVYRPNYLSFSNLTIGKFNISDFFHRKAVNRVLRNLPFRPDVIYCHFWDSALKGYAYSKKNKLPLFVASGESNVLSLLKNKRIPIDMKDYVNGVICVSTKNKEESVSLGLTAPEKCYIRPNAVNSAVFKKIDKFECRKKLGIPDDRFVISFVGAFINRKGSNRLSEAISKIKGEPVYSFFIGKGDKEPTCENILFKGQLPHVQIPVYLNASDVFVLPTLAEGCCNAIVEAMSCGLPVISSNLPFNWDVLDDSNSIMIDPCDVEAIAGAVKKLRDDKIQRNQMAEASLVKAQRMTIDQRAKDIILYIESMK